MRRRRKSKKKNSNKYWIVAITASVFATFLFRAWIFPNQIPAAASMYEVFGVDVSKHSGKIDWEKLRADGVSFTYLKATEGVDYTDPLFSYNYSNARKTGMLVGAYHFFRFNKDGRQQALQFLKVAKPNTGDLLPVIDVEYHGNKFSTKTDDQIIASIKEFVLLIEKSIGCKPIIYTNGEAYRRLIKEEFSNYPLWYCNLREEPDLESHIWQFWQYTHKGKINGAPHKIDFNVYRYSLADLKSTFCLK